MAKSEIIKDLANSKVDVFTALKRAKVLFTALGNDDLLLWINNELSNNFAKLQRAKTLFRPISMITQ